MLFGAAALHLLQTFTNQYTPYWPTVLGLILLYEIQDPGNVGTLLRSAAAAGADHVLLGTDYPFAFHDHTPVARAVSAISDETTRNLVIRDNARRFLGLEEHARP